MRNRKNNLANRISLVIGIMALAVFMAVLGGEKAHAAASSVSVKTIDYESSTITVVMNAGDTTLFVSDGKQKKWTAFTSDIASGTNEAVIDISWISLSKDYTISFKGDYSETPVSVVIPKQNTLLKAKYDLATGKVTFTGDSGRAIQWKKKDAREWNKLDSATIGEELYRMAPNGATVLFRLAPINGTGSNPGARPSKEVSVAVPKKTAAPAITIDPSTLLIPVNKYVEYRICDKYGIPVDEKGTWTSVGKEYKMPITDIKGAEKTIYDSVSNPASKDNDVYVQFRTQATSSKQVSNTVTVRIPGQNPLTGTEKDGMSIKYNSSKTFQISVATAGSDNVYEYCIINAQAIKEGLTINAVEKLTWKSISGTDPITVSKTADDCDEGSQVYIRRKTQKSQGDDEYELASDIYLLGVINYPGDVSMSEEGGESGIWRQTVAGVCNKDNSGGYMYFTFYSPAENTVQKIEFLTAGGNSRGVLKKDEHFTSDTMRNGGGSDPDKQFIITVTIKSTEPIDKYTLEPLYAKFWFGDSATFNSLEHKDDGSFMGLYIYPATKVNNPVSRSDMQKIADDLNWNDYNVEKDSIKYTTAHKRLVNSNGNGLDTAAAEYYDDTQFRIRLDLGTENLQNMNAVPGVASDGKHWYSVPNGASGTRVAVEKIKYDGVTLNEGSGCYTVSYGIRMDGTDSIRYAVITVNAAKIEKQSGVDDRNTDTKLYVYLNNKEVIEAATINYVSTATIEGNSFSASVKEHSLAETVTVTDASGNKTEDEKFDYSFNVILNDLVTIGESTISITGVYWNGMDISAKTRKEGDNKIVVTLSNKLINKIDVDYSTTENLKIEFSNGYVMSKGCSLTVIADTAAGGK